MERIRKKVNTRSDTVMVPWGVWKDYNYIVFIINQLKLVGVLPCEVGPCHHGMARPQVAYGGTASDMEGSCE